MIRTYVNTKAELNIAQLRLELLMRKKEELYTKYFPLSSKYDTVSAHTNKRSDPMAEYISELTKINPTTGMSLEQEIENERNNVNTLKYYINLMDYNLERTTGIENELFKLIVVKGRTKTKAVEIVSEKYEKEPRTIWQYYYPKIKKEIDKCTIK